MCRRLGCTGSSTPASRATRAAAGPAALITSGEAIAPGEVVHPEGRHELAGIVGCDHTHVGPERALEGDPLFESAELLGVGDEEEIADLLVAGVDTELVLEALEHADGFQREADLGLGRKLDPDPARRLARGPRADRLALHDDDVRETAPREMVGDAAADDTATDHHRARCSRQVHVVLVLWAGTRGPIVPRLAATPG